MKLTVSSINYYHGSKKFKLDVMVVFNSLPSLLIYHRLVNKKNYLKTILSFRDTSHSQTVLLLFFNFFCAYEQDLVH